MSRESTLRGSHIEPEDDEKRTRDLNDAETGGLGGEKDQRRQSWRQSMQKEKGWEDEDPFGDESEDEVNEIKYKTLAWWLVFHFTIF